MIAIKRRRPCAMTCLAVIAKSLRRIHSNATLAPSGGSLSKFNSKSRLPSLNSAVQMRSALIQYQWRPHTIRLLRDTRERVQNPAPSNWTLLTRSWSNITSKMLMMFAHVQRRIVLIQVSFRKAIARIWFNARNVRRLGQTQQTFHASGLF